MSFHPYLFFGGSCREAFTRYHEIFGGDLNLITAGEMPAEEQQEGVDKDLIMHAALVVGGSLLMGSDDPTTEGFGPVQGMQVNVDLPDVNETKRVFDALAEGGQVTMPVSATSWSSGFGMCTDRFGTPWMVSTNDAETS